LPAPEPTEPLTEPEPSPALSMIGKTWPLDGRMIGVVVAPGTSLEQVGELRTAVFKAGMVPLLIAPTGGVLADGTPGQRSYTTVRSVELDALLVADGTGAHALDPHVVLLVQETFRHGKAIGIWGDGAESLTAAGVDPSGPGVVSATGPLEVLTEVSSLMGAHRVWERHLPR
jgi:catalase